MMEAQGYNDSVRTLTSISRDIAHYVTEKELAWNNLFTRLVQNDSISYVVQVLDSLNTDDANMELAAYYMSADSLGKASARMDSVYADLGEEIRWKNLLNIHLALAEDTLGIYEMGATARAR